MKTIFDKSLFQEFIMKCIGNTVTPQMEQQLRIEKKKAAKASLSDTELLEFQSKKI